MSIEQTVTKENVLNQEHTALAAEITDMVNDHLPEEKARAERELDLTAQGIANGHAPSAFDGAGQPMGSVPSIIYMRWAQEYPGCWSDSSFKEEFLFDNPRCQIPGYKPRAKRLYFDMKHGNRKLNNFGGDLYLERRAKVNALIAADYKSNNLVPMPGV